MGPNNIFFQIILNIYAYWGEQSLTHHPLYCYL